jgi:hypothetical protein
MLTADPIPERQNDPEYLKFKTQVSQRLAQSILLPILAEFALCTSTKLAAASRRGVRARQPGTLS